MTVLQFVLLGVFGGSLGTTGLFLWLNSREDPSQQILDKQAETIKEIATLQSKVDADKVEIQKNLTNTDLLEIPCSTDYMEKHGDMLCREMFCRLQTRQGDGASQVECEQIANLLNTVTIIEQCKALEVNIDVCTSILYRRK